MEFEINNWRWAGVLFYFRTGTHMSQRNTEIAIRFRQAPYTAFQDTSFDILRPKRSTCIYVSLTSSAGERLRQRQAARPL